jgi:beta-aspartyl-dipeptidase (metallo-type)
VHRSYQCRTGAPVTFTVIAEGEVYAPEPLGRTSLLIAEKTIVHIGSVGRSDVEALGLPVTWIDARGMLVTPGLVDPHQHISGGAGEDGFATRTQEITVEELLLAGITTVVGLLGTDVTTRHLSALLAVARGLEQEGVTSYIWTGGFPVPTPTITGSATDDLVLIDKVIGIGEIAIADERSSKPSLAELARLVSQGIVGGKVAGKAGLTHVHVGPGRERLTLLHALVDEYEIPAAYLYPTHINRSPELMDDAIALAKRGSFVDTDTVDENFGECLRYFFDHGGPVERFTASSDARTADATTRKFFDALRESVIAHGFPLEVVLPCFCLTAATALRLSRKGRLAKGADADVLVLGRDTLELVHVVAQGRHRVADGALVVEQRGRDEPEALE